MNAHRIVQNLALIKSKIINASDHAQQSVRLVAVSKTRSLQEIMIAYDAGHRVFGENYVKDQI